MMMLWSDEWSGIIPAASLSQWRFQCFSVVVNQPTGYIDNHAGLPGIGYLDSETLSGHTGFITKPLDRDSQGWRFVSNLWSVPAGSGCSWCLSGTAKRHGLTDVAVALCLSACLPVWTRQFAETHSLLHKQKAGRHIKIKRTINSYDIEYFSLLLRKR